MADEVTSEERGTLLLVRLERPERRNALTRAMLERLGEIFASVASRTDLRAVILSAAGRRALHGRDDGRAAQLDSVADLLPAPRLVERRPLVHAFEFAYVRAGAEVGPGAAEDDGAQVSARGDPGEDFAEPFEHRARQGVPLRGAFEAHEEERAALFDQNRAVGAARFTFSSVLRQGVTFCCQRLAGTSKS